MVKENVPRQQNKGVHVPTDSSTFSTSTTKNDEDRSMNQIRKDVKAVIELMGPNTPHFEQSLSATEESVCPKTTSVSRQDTKLEDDPNNQTDNDFSTIPPDVVIHETDLSMVVDNPSNCSLNINSKKTCICPPPAFPASFVYNSECMCPQMKNYFQQRYPEAPEEEPKTKKSNFFFNLWKHFKEEEEKQGCFPKKGDYYTINVKQSKKNYGVPRRLVFDLVEEISNDKNAYPANNEICDECCCYKKESFYHQNEKNAKPELFPSKSMKYEDLLPVDNIALNKTDKLNKKTTYEDVNGTTKVDVYYFDHGSSHYFRTTDRSPVVTTEALAERTEAYTTKFWAELFGTFNIGVSFVTSFILQFLRFILYTVIRPLTVGMVQLISDYFFKPLLCTIFNALIQPILIFLYNIAASLRDFCDPIAEAIGYFIREIAVFIRAFRVVEVRKEIRDNISSNGSKRIVRKKRMI